MAKKPANQSTPAKSSPVTKPPTPAPRQSSTSISTPPTSKPISSASLSTKSSPQEIAAHVWNKYVQDTPSRTILLDVFMAFLILIAAVQFVYCILAGNYPFNAFLSGFCASIGQFVLTASLRMQTSERPPPGASTPAKKTTAKTIDAVTGELVEDGAINISSERAFADFVFGSLILHGFCVNFIN